MRTRLLGWLGGFALCLLALLGTTGAAGAKALACDTTAFSGQVTKAGSPLTVRSTDGRERAVTAGPGLVVIRNGATTQFNDVREGDQVNVTVPAGAADCTATRIEAASPAAVPEPDRTGLWGLLGLLGLGGLAGLLRRQPKPVHTTERVVEYPEPTRSEPVATVRPSGTTGRVEHVERIDPADTRDTNTRR
jgi:MYXO-CTERM domain-containing protein